MMINNHSFCFFLFKMHFFFFFGASLSAIFIFSRVFVAILVFVVINVFHGAIEVKLVFHHTVVWLRYSPSDTIVVVADYLFLLVRLAGSCEFVQNTIITELKFLIIHYLRCYKLMNIFYNVNCLKVKILNNYSL